MFALVKSLMEETIYFVTVSRDDRIEMILPIQKSVLSKRNIKFHTITFPKHKHIVLSGALINYEVMTKEDFIGMLDSLRSYDQFNWSFMEFTGISENSDLFNIFLADEKWLVQYTENAYFDCLNGSFEKSLSKKFLRNIKRLAQRIELEQGPVSVRFIHDPHGLQDAYKIFLDLESSGWKGENGTNSAIKHSHRLVSFYQDLICQFSEDGSLLINILYINSHPAAAQLCVKTANVWYILKIGYEEKYREYGAGNLLMLKFLEHASTDHDISEINLVTAPEWADRWHLQKRNVYNFRHYNSNLKGRFAKEIMRAKKVLDEII